MSVLIWPDHFPQRPLFSSYAISGNSATIRSDMEAGPPEVSVVSDINFLNVTLGYRFRREQLGEFWSFYRSPNGANQGANYFYLPVNITGEFNNYQVRITNFPRIILAGPKFLTISFTVETDELTV